MNETYFDSIDTETKAYLLGFITADGTINDKRKTPILQVHISIKDIYIINLLISEIGCTIKPYINKSGTSISYRTTSKKLCESLGMYNVYPRKTGNEKLAFEKIPESLVNHYIRGLIDGDGWICNTEIANGSYRTCIGYCGSEMACSQMQYYLNKRLGLFPVTVSKIKDKNNYKINYSSTNDIDKLKKYLYCNANVFLQRKRDEVY